MALVREFLEFFDLDFTTAVFDPETNAVCHVLCVYDISFFGGLRGAFSPLKMVLPPAEL